VAAYYCKIGGAIGDIGESKFGFTAPDDAYEGIGDELGIIKLKEGADRKGILFGANYPRPAKVRINYVDKNFGKGNDRKKSVTRYCDPDKLGRVLNGSLNKTKINVRGVKYAISSVSTLG